MPSPAEAAGEHRGRRVLELAMRAVAMLALLTALVRALGWMNSGPGVGNEVPLIMTTSPMVSDAHGNPVSAGAGASAAVMATVRRAVIAQPGPRALHAVVPVVPTDAVRALLSAARTAGVPLAWTDATNRAAIAIEASAPVDPRGGLVVHIAAPADTRLAVRDTLGVIDSLEVTTAGASVRVGRASGMLSATSPGGRARTPPPPAPEVRRLLLVARPGWEAKFTLAALEESGWRVDGRFAIAPRVSVTQGSPADPDTAHYSAVVALDSSVVPLAPALLRYVRRGGGVVLAGEATTLRALDSLLAGRAEARRAGVPGGLVTATPRTGLALWPIATRANAVVLERAARGTGVAVGMAANVGASALPVVVARRVGAGRVVQVGYDAIWEWRMQGGEGSVAAHRDWWARLVSSVAFAPVVPQPDSALHATPLPGESAPFADLVARLGAPVAMPATRDVSADRGAIDPWLFVAAAVALLMEWGSRRLRGAR